MTVFFGVAGAGRQHETDVLLARMRCEATRHWPQAAQSESDPGSAQAQVGRHGVAVGVAAAPGWGRAEAFTAHQDGFWAVARGLLCSRPELEESLGLGRHEPALVDAALLLRLYRRYGLDFVQMLHGDWCLALWDPQRQELILAKDPTGNCAVFWWRSASGQVFFANHLPTLMAAGEMPKQPDPQWIAGLVTVFYDPARPTATAFADVHTLPPGHLLRIRQGQVDMVRWWNPWAQGPMETGSSEELTGRFLHLYQDAVAQRLSRPGGKLGATLSGGLDSGSVVAMAAPLMAKRGERIQGFVHVPRHEADEGSSGRTPNEWALALATAQHVGAVDLKACPTMQPSPVGAISAWLDRMAVPSHVPSHWFWGLDIASQAQATGASVMLTGEGGNATVSFSGNGSLWGELLHGDWVRTLGELRLERGGRWAGIKNRLIKPALRPAWHWARHALQDAKSRGSGPGWLAFALLNPGFADQIRLPAAMKAARHDAAHRILHAHRVRAWRAGLLGGADNSMAIGHSLGLSFGLEWRDPTKDRRLVEFCLRQPDRVFWAHGQQRGLIRLGMQGQLPDAVLNCTAKGLQSSDLQARLKSCRSEGLALLDQVLGNSTVHEWFDVPRLQASWQAALEALPRVGEPTVAPAHTMRALAAASFVARWA